MHYRRWQRNGDPLAVQRSRRPRGVDPITWFRASFADTENGCSEWQHSKNGSGYGQCNRFGSGSGLAHREMWILEKGPIPDGLLVLHHCDNPPCAAMDHLWLGTQQDNVDDMIAKGRMRTVATLGEAQWNAKLTADEVREILARINVGETQTSIADIYGVSVSTINLIARGKRWKSVPRDMLGFNHD